MMRLILFFFIVSSAACALNGCGSVNFLPGKTYIGADGGDGF